MKTIQQYIDGLDMGVIGDHFITVDDLIDLELNEVYYQIADSDERVIYTHKAHELCQNVDSRTRSDAEERMYDCGGCDGKTYDEIACLIAYWIVEEEVREEFQEIANRIIGDIEKYVEELEEYKDEVAEDDFYTENEQKAEDIISVLMYA